MMTYDYEISDNNANRNKSKRDHSKRDNSDTPSRGQRKPNRRPEWQEEDRYIYLN